MLNLDVDALGKDEGLWIDLLVDRIVRVDDTLCSSSLPNLTPPSPEVSFSRRLLVGILRGP